MVTGTDLLRPGPTMTGRNLQGEIIQTPENMKGGFYVFVSSLNIVLDAGMKDTQHLQAADTVVGGAGAPCHLLGEATEV